MKHSFIILAFFISPFFVSGQIFQFEKISISAIDSLEKRQSSLQFTYGYPVDVSEDYFPSRGKYKLAQPLVYRKKVKGFNYETSYYYSLPDSTIRLIEYWWEGDAISETDLYEVLAKNRKEVALHVSQKGIYQPESEERGATEIWENKSVYVEQFFAKGLQRIRLKISWK